jgi:two-component system chemotaxis response regulator CheY
MARILITDDAAFMRMMLKNHLAAGGHEIVGEAANGEEAVRQYVALKPDVCTMDITMPEKDGITALREIMAVDPAAKVVMCSALGQETKVIEAIRSGAKDFVVKPFQQERVIAAVAKALA